VEKRHRQIIAARVRSSPPFPVASRPVYPRLVRDEPADQPAADPTPRRVPREISAAQYEWDERWDGLS
jgi:hypothetical protein